MTLDLRHPDGAALADMHVAFMRSLESAKETFGIEAAMTCVSECEPVAFDAQVLDAVRRAGSVLGLRGRDIISGAGHDAFHMASLAPTAMIFTPCVGGVSHNESEEISPEWARNGANVLLLAALEIAETI